MVLDRTTGKGGDEARAAPRVRREGSERQSERRASSEAQRRALEQSDYERELQAQERRALLIVVQGDA